MRLLRALLFAVIALIVSVLVLASLGNLGIIEAVFVLALTLGAFIRVLRRGVA